MDAIGSSTGILWLFGIIFGLPVVLLIFSLLIWKYKNNRRLSCVFYVSATVLTVFLSINNFNNIILYFPWSAIKFQLCLMGSILMGVAFIVLVCSIFLYRKRRKTSIILHNISSALAVIVWFSMMKAVNM